MRPVCWNIVTQVVKKYARDTLISTILLKKCDVSVLLEPSSGEHIKVCRNKSTSERVQLYIYIYIYI